MRAKMIDAHEFCNSLQSLGGDVQSEKTNTKFARLSINLGELLRELGRLKSRNRAIAELQFAASRLGCAIDRSDVYVLVRALTAPRDHL